MEIKEEEKKLASWGLQKFKDAMMAKETAAANWMNYLNAWNNSLYENASTPSYKSNQISNFIFSTIESMRPIMFDSSPTFEAIPVTREAVEYVGEINRTLDYEFDRTNMQQICVANSIYTFVIGTSIIMLTYEFSDMPGASVDGDVKPIPVNPFNIFPDPLATSVDDAEYIIYATYQHENVLKKKFPDKAELIVGADIQYSELVNNRNEGASIKNQVLVLEIWCRDYTTIEVEQEDGTKKVNSQFPLGRVITMAPDLSIIFDDKPNPYNSGRFPFFLFKDLDVPFQFWGEGEVKWLLSPQQAINDMSNQIIDNAKNTANMQWIIDKNAGIPQGTLTNRPGLVIRKNPGTSVERPSPPSMPMYVSEKINALKMDIEVISGVHDVTRGQSPSGIESGSAIMALQEAAQTRIRLKLKLHEMTLGDMGTEWLRHITQFWKMNRLIPIASKAPQTVPLGQPGVGPQVDPVTGQPVMEDTPKYDFIEISHDKQLSQTFKVKIVGSSTAAQNRASMFEVMIRLAQTMAEDSMPMVPREAVLDFLPNVNKDRIIQLFKEREMKQMQLQQQQMQSQNTTAQTQQILQGMTGQMQSMSNDLGAVQGKLSAEEQKKQEEALKSQGYDQGIKESMAAEQQTAKTGGVPPELEEQMANMSDEELMQFLAENPDVAEAI